MDALETAVEALAAKLREEEAKPQQAKQEAEAAQTGLTYARLARLYENGETLWFFDTFIKPLHAAEQAKALDIKLSRDARDAAAQRADIAQEIMGKLAFEMERRGNEVKEK